MGGWGGELGELESFEIVEEGSWLHRGLVNFQVA